MTIVYQYFAADGTLLYVGMTDNPTARHIRHKNESPWFAEVATIERESYALREVAHQREKELIRGADPKHNQLRYADSEVISLSLPLSVVRAIEYHAYLHRVSKSEAVAQLIRKSAEAAPDATPASLALVG